MNGYDNSDYLETWRRMIKKECEERIRNWQCPICGGPKDGSEIKNPKDFGDIHKRCEK